MASGPADGARALNAAADASREPPSGVYSPANRSGVIENRARFEPAELTRVLSRFDIGAIEHQQDFPRGSAEAAKMLIRTNRGRFILKRRPRLKSDLAAVAFSHHLQNFLAEQSFPVPHLIGTRGDNESMLLLDDAVYELFEFIPGERFVPSPEGAREAGRMLAVFHRLVEGMPLMVEPPTSHYHDSPRARGMLTRIGEELPRSAGAPSARGREADVAQLVDRLRDAYDTAAAAAHAAGYDDWTPQVVHSDWHPGNVLFHENHVVAVLDFDSARVMPPVTDIANGALQFSIERGGRNLDTWPETCNPDRLRAFVGGCDEHRRLSVAELAVIPPLMIEAIIAESLGPIVTTGHFAGLDGFGFLGVVDRKVRWIQQHAAALLRL